MSVVVKIKNYILWGNIRRDPQGLRNVLISEEALLFQEHLIPLITVGKPKCTTCVLALKDVVMPRMTNCVISGYVNCLDEDAVAVECMVIHRSCFLGLVWRNPGPVVIYIVGRSETQIQMFNPFPEAIIVPTNMVMGTLEPTMGKWILVTEECPLD